MPRKPKQPTEFLVITVIEPSGAGGYGLDVEVVSEPELTAWRANNPKTPHKIVVGEEYEPIVNTEYRSVSAPTQQPAAKKAGRPKGSKSKPKPLPGASDLLDDKKGKPEAVQP